MSETERITVATILTLLLFLVPTYVLHASDEFAGSLGGFAIAVIAFGFMLAALLYPALKNSSRLRRFISARAALSLHAYCGVLGIFLATLHTGHKFRSYIGITLIVLLLVIAISGFVGRYYFPRSITELREGQSRLAAMRSAFNRLVQSMSASDHAHSDGLQGATDSDVVSVARLVDGIAELEYHIGSQQAMKLVLARWMFVHVTASILLVAILFAHIAGEIYYGLKWIR